MHKSLEVSVFALFSDGRFTTALDAEKGHVSVDSGSERWQVPGWTRMEDKSTIEARLPMGEWHP